MKACYLILIVLAMLVSVQLAAQTPIIPQLNYVWHLGPDLYQAWLGYQNNNATTITIPAGTSDNYFSPGSSDLGQVTTFLPGTHEAVFSVIWDGSYLEWALRTPKSPPYNPHQYLLVDMSAAYEDEDLDTVFPPIDLYPDDPDRAFDVYYPSTGMNTLAFEDLWPQVGDYDFNDMVIDYQFKYIHNNDNEIKDIFAELELRSVGATFQDAFLIELPISFANIESYQGYHDGAPVNMPMYAAGTKSVIKVIGNTADYVPVPGFDIFWNSQLSQPTYPTIKLSFEISLITPVDPGDLPYLAPFNPYINVNRVVGHEVHLPGMPPTAFANPDLFGLNDDTTDPGTGRYYVTSTNLPWALNITGRWRYPVEKKQVTHAYLNFAAWAESGGTINQDWFEYNLDNCDPDFVYPQGW
ncbi:MAG: LruC domain-containing protein [Candidatus Cloacimonetes bacterium]|nr:LruC domain-containing protein [Candidatus Cloacimonadota bacterium]